MQHELFLEGLFFRLVRQYDFALGYQDYVDMLEALRAGYGDGSRASLLWLCQTMWARSAEQQRILQLLFEGIPRPKSEEVKQFEDELHQQQLAPVPMDNPPETVQPPVPDDNQPPFPIAPDENIPSPGVDISQQGDDGLGLPRAQVQMDMVEKFVFTPRPILPMRSLVIAWRRYRQPMRIGAKTELDIAATIQRRCQEGWLDMPVLRAPRRNMARLIVLIDLNESMRPWYRLNETLVRSLEQSGIQNLQCFYFHRVPQDDIYVDESMNQPVSLTSVMQKHSNSGVLIFSDAGAAVGKPQSRLVKNIKVFAEQALRHNWRPLVWVNPLPSQRWKETAVSHLQRLPHVAVVSLSDDGLIGAVDILRGIRTTTVR